jgi:hypothetical protein
MWDVPVFTDQTTLENRPGIVLHDKKKDKTCLLIDIAIPDDSKVDTKTDKLWKYEDLEIEVSRMWKVRTKIVLL